MTFELTLEERLLLVRLLEREISDLKSEIRNTQTRQYRDKLKGDKSLMKHLVGRLREATPIQRG